MPAFTLPTSIRDALRKRLNWDTFKREIFADIGMNPSAMQVPAMALAGEQVMPALEKMMPIIRSLARRYRILYGGKEPIEDLIQEGSLGFAQAAERFDPSLGVPFEAYATQRVKGNIIDAIRNSIGRSGYGPGLEDSIETLLPEGKIVSALAKKFSVMPEVAEEGFDFAGFLSILPSRQKQVFSTYSQVFDELGELRGAQVETAKRLQMNKGTLAATISQIRAKAREFRDTGTILDRRRR